MFGYHTHKAAYVLLNIIDFAAVSWHNSPISVFRNPSVASCHLQDKMQVAYETENTNPFRASSHRSCNHSCHSCLFLLQSAPGCDVFFLSPFTPLSWRMNSPLSLKVPLNRHRQTVQDIHYSLFRPLTFAHTHLVLHLEQYMPCARYLSTLHALCSLLIAGTLSDQHPNYPF